MKRKKYRPLPSNTLLSGGIRVKKSGLYEALCECTVITGCDNSRLSKERYVPCMVFNSIWDGTHPNYWLDVVPVWNIASKLYFKRIGDCINAEKITKINAKITIDIPWFDFMCNIERKHNELKECMRDKDNLLYNLQTTLDDMKDKIRTIVNG